MFDLNEYRNLTSKYGSYSSWAIWDHKNEGDLSAIEQNFNQLHSKYIFLGLNISRPLLDKSWANFHGGKHDRKIKYACNDNRLRGSYITDIFKGVAEPNSSKLKQNITNEIISKNVQFFNLEMKDLKINDESIFIIFGTPTSLLAQFFNKYFKQNYTNIVLYHCHYSFRSITDEEWVTELWKKLNIKQDYSQTREKYR